MKIELKILYWSCVAFVLSTLIGMCIAQAQVKISQLPVGHANATTSGDSFPFVNSTSGTTEQMTLWDLLNLPPFQTQFQSMIPAQTGNSGKFLSTNGTVTSWQALTAGANQFLSNLSSPTAINQNLLFSTTDPSIGIGTNLIDFSDSTHSNVINVKAPSSQVWVTAPNAQMRATEFDLVGNGVSTPGNAWFWDNGKTNSFSILAPSTFSTGAQSLTLPLTYGTSGQALVTSGGANAQLSYQTFLTGPGGSNTQVQVNASGILSGFSHFTYTDSPVVLTLGTPGVIPTPTPTPATLNMGDEYSSTHGLNPKLLINENLGNALGPGPAAITAVDNGLEVLSYSQIDFWSGGSAIMRVDGMNLYPDQNGVNIGNSRAVFQNSYFQALYIYDLGVDQLFQIAPGGSNTINMQAGNNQILDVSTISQTGPTASKSMNFTIGQTQDGPEGSFTVTIPTPTGTGTPGAIDLTGNEVLKDGGSNLISQADSTHRQLFDASGVLSIDYLNRIAYDSTGTIISVDWGGRNLVDGHGNNVISWYLAANVMATVPHVLLNNFNGVAAFLTGCGTGASLSGLDGTGKITMGAGVTTTCTLNFGQPWSDGSGQVQCWANWEGTTIQVVRAVPSPATSSTSVTFTAATGFSSGQILDYGCEGF